MDNTIFSVFPNPFNDNVTIQNPNKETILEYYWIDITGRILDKQTLNQDVAETNIATDKLTSGLYVLVCKTDKATFTFKMIKQ